MASASNDAAMTLQNHIEDMRNLVQCKICLRPLYEPYILACGHTYCYSCLNNWFTGGGERRRNKNCPDCRTIVKAQPAPNYLLRDLTHMFVGRTELLPEDESVEGYMKEKEEEAALITKHRTGPGLFQGVFERFSHHHFNPHHHVLAPHFGGVIRDLEDGVDRCPRCAWEMEDGHCMGCNYTVGSDDDLSDISISDEDEDDDDDSEDDSIVTADDEQSVATGASSRAVSPVPAPHGFPRFYGVESDSEDAEQNEYDLHDDFVDDENEDDLDGIYDVDEHAEYPGDAATPYSEATDYTVQNDDEAIPSIVGNSDYHNPVLDTVPTSFSEAEEEGWEDEDAIVRPSTRRTAVSSRRRQRPIVISDEEEDEESISHGQSDGLGPGSHDFQLRSQSIESTNPRADDHSSNSGESGSEDEDDSASGSGSGSDESEEAEGNVSESSDETAIPPQSGRDRRRRVQEHKARRSTPQNHVTVDLVTPGSAPHHRYRRSMARDVSRRRNRATPVH